MKIYKFRKYDKSFPTLFNHEKKMIENVILKNSQIEHVGSTSVPKMRGKGVIDLIIYSPKNKTIEIKSDLEKLGYEEGSVDKDRIFLKREYKIKNKTRRFHTHIISNKKLWNSAIVFRNFLINNKKVFDRYEKLKEKAIIACNNDGKIYRKLKNGFIKKQIKIALSKS